MHHLDNFSLGNKFWFREIFVEALDEFPRYFIQSKTSTSTHECSESNVASKFLMLLSNFWDEHRGLSQFSWAKCTQRSSAKIQRHFRFSSSRTLGKFEEKTCKNFLGNVIKIVVGEKITSWETLRMSASKFPGHMRSTKLNCSATVLTLGLKAKNFSRKFKTLLRESFGGNCARAPRLTAVWAECRKQLLFVPRLHYH